MASGEGVKVGTGYIQILPEMKDFTAALNSETGSASTEAGEHAGSNFGSGLKKGLAVAAGAAVAAAGAITAVGTSSVKAGMDFDAAMSQVAATMGLTVDDIQDLRSFAQEMGATTAFSATEAANALNYMALAGYDAETAMAMLPTVLDLAAAGGIDLASASDMVTDAQSALGLSLDETSDMVDKMAKASSKSNTSVAQLGEAILKIGGTANVLSGGTTELATALGLLADNGIKGAEGGTHLRNILLSLASPTTEAESLLKDLGVTAVDSEGNMRPLQDIMLELNDALDGMGEADKAAIIGQIFNKTDIASVNALLGTSKDRWKELSGAIDNASGSAQAMAETQLDNLAGDVTLFKSALEGAQIAISDSLTPTIREFVQFGSESLSDFTVAFQKDGIEGAMSAVGAAIAGLSGKITKALPNMVEAVGSLLSSLAGELPTLTQSIVKVLPSLMQSIFTEAGSIAGSMIPALVESIGTLLLNIPSLLVGTVSGIVDGIGNLFEGIADSIDEAVSPRFSNADGLFQNTIASLQTNGEYAFTQAANNLKMTWAKVIGNTNWQDALTGLTLAQDALQAIKDDYDTFKKDLAEWSPEAAEVDFEIKSGTITSLVDQISSLVDANGNALSLESGSLLKTLTKQVNDLLGTETLTVTEDTVIKALISDMQAEWADGYSDTDPVTFVTDWLVENTDIENPIPYDVLTWLSCAYNMNPEAQTEKPEDWLKAQLESGAFGTWDEATIDIICNLLANDGTVTEAWFSPEEGTFADSVKAACSIPDTTDISAAVNLILTKTENGTKVDDLTISNLVADLQEIEPDVDWEKAISITVGGIEDVGTAIEKLKQLTLATYAQKSMEIAMDETIDLHQRWIEQKKLWAEASERYNKAVVEGDADTAKTAYQELQTIRDGFSMLTDSVDYAEDQYIVSLYNMQAAEDGTDIAHSIEEVPDIFRESMSGVSNAVSGFTSEMDIIDAQLAETTGAVLEAAAAGDETAQALVNDAANTIAVYSQTASSWDELASRFSFTTDSIGTLQQVMSDYHTDIASGVSMDIDSLFDWIYANENAVQFMQQTGIGWEQLETLIGELAENENLATDATSDFADEAAEAIIPTEDLKGNIEELGDQMSATGAQAGEAGKQMSTGYADGIESGIPDVENAADGTSRAALNAWVLANGDMTKVGYVACANVSGGMLSGEGLVEDAGAALADAAKEGVANLPTDMDTAGDSSGQSLNDAFAGWSDTVWATVDDMYEIFNSSLGVDLSTNMMKWGNKAGKKFDYGFSSYQTTIETTVSNLAAGIETKLTDLPTKLLSLGTKSGLGLYSGLSKYKSQTTTLADNMATSIGNSFGTLYSYLYSAGVYGGQGLYLGMQKWEQSLYNLASSIGTNISNKIATALKVQSPSKVTMEIGEYVGEGLAIGIMSGGEIAVEASEDMTYDVIDAIAGTRYEYDPVTTANESETDVYLEQIVGLLDELRSLKVVMDSGEVVGVLAPGINNEFERMNRRQERG